MKRTVLLLLFVLMVLCVVAVLAEPTVGSHPQQGDQGGARAAILEKLLGHGGVMANRAILDALNMSFGAVGENQSDAVRGKGAAPLGSEEAGEEKGTGQNPDVGDVSDNPGWCASCEMPMNCTEDCVISCECASGEAMECGVSGPGAGCMCDEDCIGGGCCADCPGLPIG